MMIGKSSPFDSSTNNSVIVHDYNIRKKSVVVFDCGRRLPGFDQSVWRDPDRFDRDLAAACQRHGMPLRAQAIIGEVDLVDVVQDSISLWAEPNSYHWIVANPRLYERPILGVKGHLRLWHYKGPLPSCNIS
jgi:hypothetical protein